MLLVFFFGLFYGYTQEINNFSKEIIFLNHCEKLNTNHLNIICGGDHTVKPTSKGVKVCESQIC